MSARRFAAIALGLALIAALQTVGTLAKPGPGGCSDPAGCVIVGAGEAIPIGTLTVTELGVIGRESAQAVELAAETRGDVAGHPIQLIHLGDGCEPGLAETSAQAVAADRQLAAVIGTTCSGAAYEVIPVLGGAAIMSVSPSATRPDLTDPTTHDPYFFRFAYNDVYHADELAAFLLSEGYTTAAVVSEDHVSPAATGARFADLFAMAGTITSERTVAAGQDDFSVELAAIAAEDPDVIAVFTFQLAAFVTQARDTVGLEATPLASTSDLAGTMLDQIADPADAEGMVAASPNFGFLANETYLTTLGAPFTTAFGEPPTLPYHAYAWDTTNRLLDVLASFAQGDDKKLVIGRTALRDAFAATSGYVGVSGTFTCGPDGDCNPQDFVIQIVEGGVLVDPS